MISNEKLLWLRDKKGRGDIAAVVKQMNPRNLKSGISYTEAVSIVNGNLYGKWGKLFTDALERRIKARVKRIEMEKNKYSLK